MNNNVMQFLPSQHNNNKTSTILQATTSNNIHHQKAESSRPTRHKDMVRPPACCGNVNLKRGLWTPEEDAKILAHVAKHGTGNWTSAPKKAGLRRCGKSCRLRWNNYLRPDLNHETFKPEEEEMIVKLHAAIGSRWSIIAQQLPGRTDNDVKNHWNTKLRKKLSEMGIDPVTHKPFSQILTDYGNINGGISSRPRIGSLNRDHLKTANTANPLPQSAGVSSISTNNFMDEKDSEILPISDCYIINNNNNMMSSDVNEGQSLDLMDQLQAIKLVTEAATAAGDDYYPSFPSSSSSSSSSSTCSTAAAAAAAAASHEMMMSTRKSSPPFSWRDFLLEDDDVQIPEEAYGNDDDIGMEIWSPGEKQRNQQQSSYAVAATNVGSSASSSFVEGILNGDGRRDMFLDFSSLLQDPNY
ncbi:Transcription factor MYB35 [Linum perenne]